MRWNRVKTYLAEFGVATCGDGGKLPKGLGFSQEVAKDSFIPENIFYRLAMKAKNEVAEKFQAKIADEVNNSVCTDFTQKRRKPLHQIVLEFQRVCHKSAPPWGIPIHNPNT